MFFDFNRKKKILTYTPERKEEKKQPPPQEHTHKPTKLDLLVIESKELLDRPTPFSNIPIKDAQIGRIVNGTPSTRRTKTTTLYDQFMK